MELLLLGLVAALLWKLYQLKRSPHDAPLRSVTLCLLCAALSYPVAMPGGASGVDTVAGHGTAKLIQNVLLLLAVYFLMCFYLYSAADEEAGRRRARKEAVVVGVVAVAITVAAESVPHEVFAGSFSTADMTIPQIAFFYSGAGLYLMYALGMACRWTRRYARMSRRPHSTGLWMAAVGLGAMAVACAIRAVIVAVRWADVDVPQPLMAAVAFLLVVSVLLFAAGITYSGARARISSLRLWLQHRRDHRRIVECRDGLVDISPYLLDEDDDSAVLSIDSTELAARLRRASARIGDGVPAPRRAVPLAMALGSDRQSDVKQLIAVSDALRDAA